MFGSLTVFFKTETFSVLECNTEISLYELIAQRLRGFTTHVTNKQQTLFVSNCMILTMKMLADVNNSVKSYLLICT